MNRKKQTTMKRFLLPHAFQKAGWWLLLASLVTGAAALVLDTISGPLPDGAVTAEAAKAQPLMQAVIIGAQLSIFLIACSREKVEDEMVSSMRLRAIASVACVLFTIYTAIAVVSTITGGVMAKDLASSIASPPIAFWAYEIVLRISIARNRKHSSL